MSFMFGSGWDGLRRWVISGGDVGHARAEDKPLVAPDSGWAS